MVGYKGFGFIRYPSPGGTCRDRHRKATSLKTRLESSRGTHLFTRPDTGALLRDCRRFSNGLRILVQVSRLEEGIPLLTSKGSLLVRSLLRGAYEVREVTNDVTDCKISSLEIFGGTRIESQQDMGQKKWCIHCY